MGRFCISIHAICMKFRPESNGIGPGTLKNILKTPDIPPRRPICLAGSAGSAGVGKSMVWLKPNDTFGRKTKKPAGAARTTPDFCSVPRYQFHIKTHIFHMKTHRNHIKRIYFNNFGNWDQNRKLQDEGYPLGVVLEGDGFRYDGKWWMALE